MYFNNIQLPVNSTYSLGSMGNQVQLHYMLFAVINIILQLHLIVTIAGSFSPNSKAGIYVLANENKTEYTAITIKAGGMYICSIDYFIIKYASGKHDV